MRRAAFAFRGIAAAWRAERSFRTEVAFAVLGGGLTAWLRPGWLWAALVGTAIALVLAAELINTALEKTLDGLHPAQASFVAVAKDCAAAAVLVFSLLSLAILVFMLLDVAGGRGWL